MASKFLIILSTGEKEKALTGLLYPRNSQKKKWLDDVKVVFFGPFESRCAGNLRLSALRLKRNEGRGLCSAMGFADNPLKS